MDVGISELLLRSGMRASAKEVELANDIAAPIVESAVSVVASSHRSSETYEDLEGKLWACYEVDQVDSDLRRVVLGDPSEVDDPEWQQLDDRLAIFTRVAIERGRSGSNLVGVKDLVLIDSYDNVTGAPESMRRLVPGARSTLVASLLEDGATVVGKTTMMDMSIGLPDLASGERIPRNPWGPQHWSGGSSSGSAIGVATGIFDLGIGTDTLGSSRTPAVNCGVVGLKPTFGLLPRLGSVVTSPTLDHLGLIAGSVDRVERGLTTCSPETRRTSRDRLAIGVLGPETGKRVSDDVAKSFRRAVAALRGEGFELVDVRLPDLQLLEEAVRVVYAYEISWTIRSLAPDIWDWCKPNTRARLVAGLSVSPSEYLAAHEVLTRMRRTPERWFPGCDVLVMPATGRTSLRLDELSPVAHSRNSEWTSAWSGLGVPAMVLPVELAANGLPVGVQFVAEPYREADLFATSRILESVVKFPRFAGISHI